VNLNYKGATYAIDPLELRARVDYLDAVNQAYLVGRTGLPGDKIITQFQALFGGAGVTPKRLYSAELLRSAVAQVAAKVNSPGRAATQVGIISTRAEPAVTVDEPMTLAQIAESLTRAPAGKPLTVNLVVAESAFVPDSSVAAAAAASSAAAPSSRFATSLVLASGTGMELALDPATLASMEASGSAQLDAEKLRSWLTKMAAQINLPARDARLRFNPNSGGVFVTQESIVGRALDVEATFNAVQNAVASGSSNAELVINEVLPAVDGRRVAEMGIQELVASSSTYFAGSSADRIKNIEVAADKFEGVVIPPDGIFSFNRIVEDVSAANGFEDSLIIWGDRTAVGIGGGVCQVSTTVFRTAYEGGFPIVERYNHGYVVGWYGEPGMDATIYTPSVDFKFRNDTGAYLLIEPYVDAANGVITFNFYGTAPNRTVTVSAPKISDVTKPDPPSYTLDASLAAGTRKQVEYAVDGMTVEVTRTIVEDGVTRTDTLRSQYVPWKAVYLVAPGDDALGSAWANPGG
jgi:vancomycin resistance protein YoaR